ncbi:hypothetical protein AMTRI_Chr02g215690 [Amborella trichopoda]
MRRLSFHLFITSSYLPGVAGFQISDFQRGNSASSCLVPKGRIFQKAKVWLTLHHLPLHAWSPASFRRIAETCGNLISIRWKFMETRPLGSILLLVEVLDPKNIPPCVWIEVDNTFYSISLAWSEASPPSVNLIDSRKANRRHHRNPHDHFPGKRDNRPSFSASHQSSQWIPRGILPMPSGDGGDGGVRESVPLACLGPTHTEPIPEGGGVGHSCHLPSGLPASSIHRLRKEVVENIVRQPSPGLSGSLKDPSSSVGAMDRASVADPTHVLRTPTDEVTHVALKLVSLVMLQVPLSPCVPGSHEETAATFSLPSIASAAALVPSDDIMHSAQDTLPPLPLPLGLSPQPPPDGPPNGIPPSILSSYEDPPRPSSEPTPSQSSPFSTSQALLASILSFPPYRSSLAGPTFPLHFGSPSILSVTFLPLPFHSHSDPSLFASSLTMEVDTSLLAFGIIMVYSLHLSPLDPSHLSELLGPFLPQPSLLIPLGRIMTVLFPYEFSPTSPFDLGPQPYPYHFFYHSTPLLYHCLSTLAPIPFPAGLLPPSPTGPLPSLKPPLSPLLVHHLLLLPPRITQFLSFPRHLHLILAKVNQCPCCLTYIPLFSLTSPPNPLNLL